MRFLNRVRLPDSMARDARFAAPPDRNGGAPKCEPLHNAPPRPGISYRAVPRSNARTRRPDLRASPPISIRAPTAKPYLVETQCGCISRMRHVLIEINKNP